MAAPLIKNAVRTTFVSGSSSTFRRFGCHAGAATTASLFFVVCAAILRVVLDHQAHQSEPPEVAGDLGKGVGNGDVARLQPRERIKFQGRYAERGGERALEP